MQRVHWFWWFAFILLIFTGPLGWLLDWWIWHNKFYPNPYIRIGRPPKE